MTATGFHTIVSVMLSPALVAAVNAGAPALAAVLGQGNAAAGGVLAGGILWGWGEWGSVRNAADLFM
ncbi:MAG: hypothetical protein MUC60_14805 [Oscillatoria sp. Prado101]|nr:hypothetical protein [Oscillatoria sp. Prado101]